jgi:putative transposase
MAINLDLIDQLLKHYQKPEDILGEKGMFKQLTKAVLDITSKFIRSRFRQA